MILSTLPTRPPKSKRRPSPLRTLLPKAPEDPLTDQRSVPHLDPEVGLSQGLLPVLADARYEERVELGSKRSSHRPGDVTSARINSPTNCWVSTIEKVWTERARSNIPSTQYELVASSRSRSTFLFLCFFSRDDAVLQPEIKLLHIRSCLDLLGRQSKIHFEIIPPTRALSRGVHSPC